MATLKEIKVTVLNGSNYARWRVEVEDVLTGEGVWSIVDGSNKMPRDDPADEKKHAAYNKWISGDGKARSILRATLDDVTFNQWKDNDDVNTFMSTLHVLASKIDACGKAVKTSDEWLISKTLSSLPVEYGPFVASWNMMAGPDPKMSVFREKLMLTEQMIKSQEENRGYPKGPFGSAYPSFKLLGYHYTITIL
ncbi:uncharacterized protein LOC129600541 [Paramacrobiotus metropolitanus]|uniref:uncharacterized protein LOC129600541 n=1 Tax=Paramacrobiotus metropolitanus TaxID=2943436 RepID=UPI0024460FCF|nr:uncharacterized protein LOC129600541 [Paramacrobiotus metropolitanus]